MQFSFLRFEYWNARFAAIIMPMQEILNEERELKGAWRMGGNP
jgi:hypothetical protein